MKKVDLALFNQELGTNYKRIKDINWNSISRHLKLTPEFMEKHWGDLDKDNISKYQKLTPELMDKHWGGLNKYYISKYQKLTPELMEKYDIKLGNDNWLYVSEEIKKESVIKSGLYECYDDYFIAYKGIRSDRCSNFNFQYQYLPGESYESHADCSNNENSFGLSVWTEDGARDYCSQLVVKCMVYYKDVARMVHNNGKLRCFKIKILN